MKLYTRTGDDGSTGLYGGGRVRKDDRRIEACGDVDELNCHLGLAMAACKDAGLATTIQILQERLFELGADLATPAAPAMQADDVDSTDGVSKADTPRRYITATSVTEMEREIDAACDGLPEMKSFILPGGQELAARLHVARAVCRRAERRCWTLAQHDNTVGQPLLQFLNRVSDLLFAMARRANHLAGCPDTPWHAPAQSD